jgi:hypothetical protein
LDAKLAKSSGAIGGTLISLFILLLVAVVFSYIRVFRKVVQANDATKSAELSQIQEHLNDARPAWF